PACVIVWHHPARACRYAVVEVQCTTFPHGLQEKVSFLQKNAGKALTLPRQKPGSPQKSTGIP
ncbi:hypothetical protein, partial [Vescimonas sp.]|uniref:hypothetical protein n=1 Tax=Vescimonas sp. TaxID=2892404 RepID=UPI00307E0406